MGICDSDRALEQTGLSTPPHRLREQILSDNRDFFAVENCMCDSNFENGKKVPRNLTSPWTLSNTTWHGRAKPFCPYKVNLMVSEWKDARLTFEYKNGAVHFSGEGEMTWGKEDVALPKDDDIDKKYKIKTTLRHRIHFDIKYGRLTRNPKTKKIDVMFVKKYKYIRQPSKKLVADNRRNLRKLYQEGHKDFFKLPYDSRQHPEYLVTYQTDYFGTFKIGSDYWEMEGIYQIHEKSSRNVIDVIDSGIFSMKAPSVRVTQAINDIKSWDVNVFVGNVEATIHYSLKSLKVKDSTCSEWVTSVKESQANTEPWVGNTKTTVDGTEVILTKPLGIEELVLKSDFQNEISLYDMGQLTQNPWFAEPACSTWKDSDGCEDILWKNLFSLPCIGFYYWHYDRYISTSCKAPNVEGYNTVKIVFYCQGNYQHRVELTGSLLPPEWFLNASETVRKKIEYAAKNDFDYLRVCVNDRLGNLPYLAEDCELGTDGKVTKIVDYFNKADKQHEKLSIELSNWGNTRVIPYIAIGTLDHSRCFEEEPNCEPDWWKNLSDPSRFRIKDKFWRKIKLSSENDQLTEEQIRDVTSYFKKLRHKSDAPFREGWYTTIDNKKKEMIVSKIVNICRLQNCGTIHRESNNNLPSPVSRKSWDLQDCGYQDQKKKQAVEAAKKEMRGAFLHKLQSQYGKNFVCEAQLNRLYNYINKRVLQMKTKLWLLMEKQLHDVEDWFPPWKITKKAVRKSFNESNDIGPFPFEALETLSEWAVFTFGTRIVNRDDDDEEEGPIGLLILIYVADSAWELKCIAFIFEFARLLEPDGLAKVENSYSRFQIEQRREDKLKRRGSACIWRGSNRFHRSSRPIHKRANTARQYNSQKDQNSSKLC